MSSSGNSDDEFDDPTTQIADTTAHEDDAGSTVAPQHTLQEQFAGGATGEEALGALGAIVVKTEGWNREEDSDQGTQGSIVVVKQESVLESEDPQS